MPSPSEASGSRSQSPAENPKETKETVNEEEEESARSTFSSVSFESLGLIAPLLTALEQLKYTKPTEIQAESIPYALQGRDIIGVAETVRNSTCS